MKSRVKSWLKYALHNVFGRLILLLKVIQFHFFCFLTVLKISSDVVPNVFASVLPLLLLFCLCGGVGDFKSIPFDPKPGLISYHTEGQGEDKVLVQMDLKFTCF